MANFSIYINDKELKKLESIAKREQKSRNQVIREAIQAKIKEES